MRVVHQRHLPYLTQRQLPSRDNYVYKHTVFLSNLSRRHSPTVATHDLQNERPLVTAEGNSLCEQRVVGVGFSNIYMNTTFSAVAAHLCAVVVMASTISIMRCRAESVPMVISVPQKSLSMEPTMPTMFRWEELLAS